MNSVFKSSKLYSFAVSREGIPLLLLVFEAEKNREKKRVLMIQEVAAENKGALCSAVSQALIPAPVCSDSGSAV